MLNAISLQVFSLIYVFVLAIVYFSKRKYNFIESKIYKYMLVMTMIILILDGVISYLTFNLIDSYVSILTKGLFIGLFIWFILFALYVLLSRSNKKYETFSELLKAHTSLYLWSGIAICLFTLLIILQLWVNYLKLNNNTYQIDLIYSFGIVIAVIVLLNLLLNNKDVAKHKNMAILFSVIMLVCIIFGEIFFGSFFLSDTSIISSGICLITLFQYFTMENPDLKYVDELNALKLKAEEANDAKTDFLASMSHEIRTPMNAINGLSANLLNGNIPAEYREDIRNINEAGNILLEIVNNILDISKVEAGKMQLENKPYSLADMIAKLSHITKLSLSEKPVTFETIVTGNMPKTVMGDEVKIYQILMNILSNAVKYTKKGSIKFMINSVISGNNDILTFKVTDTGVGIKKADNAKIFMEFERLDQEKSDIQGTGLGLVITKKLLELMGGKISFTSVYQEGTTFTIELTQEIVDKDKIDYSTYKTKKVTVDEFFDGSMYKVLLVDDNLLNLKVAEKLLKNYNLQITSVKSGLECLSYTRNNKYDLVLMDHMMPEMDGIHTLYNLKQRASGFDTPVVVLTANAIEGSREMYLKEGFVDYLSKPIDQVELDRVLREWLNVSDDAPTLPKDKIDNSMGSLNTSLLSENNANDSNSISSVSSTSNDVVEKVEPIFPTSNVSEADNNRTSEVAPIFPTDDKSDVKETNSSIVTPIFPVNDNTNSSNVAPIFPLENNGLFNQEQDGKMTDDQSN